MPAIDKTLLLDVPPYLANTVPQRNIQDLPTEVIGRILVLSFFPQVKIPGARGTYKLKSKRLGYKRKKTVRRWNTITAVLAVSKVPL